MAHSDSYTEASPTDSTLSTSIDDEIVKSRRMIRERFAVDHKVSSSDDASNVYGVHTRVTFEARISQPTEPTGAIATLYLKTGDYDSEIRFTDERDIDNLIVIVGEVKMILGTTLPDGWLALNGETLGSAASNADNTGTDYQDLYYYLWTELADAESPMLESGGGASSRGASAAADWSANKRLTMPDARSRVPIGAGTGSGLTARTIGDTGGDETKTFTHVHGLNSHTHTGPEHNHKWFDLLSGDQSDHSFNSGGTGVDFDSTTRSVTNPLSRHSLGVSTGTQTPDILTTPTQDYYTDNGGTGNTSPATGNTATPTGADDVMNPWIAFTYIIKY